MAQQIVTHNGHVVGTLSWVGGFKPLNAPSRKLDEDDVLTHALWLERHVSSETGFEFIERWVRGENLVH